MTENKTYQLIIRNALPYDSITKTRESYRWPERIQNGRSTVRYTNPRPASEKKDFLVDSGSALIALLGIRCQIPRASEPIMGMNPQASAGSLSTPDAKRKGAAGNMRAVEIWRRRRAFEDMVGVEVDTDFEAM
jgi:hypothetical protein